MPRKNLKVPPESKLALAVADVAALVSLSEDTVREQIANGQLEHVRVGHRILITRQQVDEWLRRLAEKTANEDVRARLGPNASEQEIADARWDRDVELGKAWPPRDRSRK